MPSTVKNTSAASAALSEYEERPVMYVNITVIDPSGAVEDKVTGKIQNSKLPRLLKNSKAAKTVAKTVASKVVKPAMVAKKLADKLPEEMPAKMKENGLTVVAKQVFLEGPFIVLQLQVLHVDAVAAAEAQGSKSSQSGSSGMHEWVGWFLGMFGTKFTDNLQSQTLPKIVQTKMSQILGEKMKEKMEEKKMIVDCKTFPEEQQARFFFSHLEEIRADAAKKGSGNFANSNSA